MKRMSLFIVFGLIIIIGLGLFSFIYFGGSSKQTESSQSDSSTSESTTETTTSETIEPSKIDALLSEMTLEEKVGQLFFVRVPEANQLEDIQTYHLGGYVLFGRDVENETKDSLTQKIADYQAASDIPLLIGADEEGGTVTRISHNPELAQAPFESPQTLYANGGWSAIREDTKEKAQLLKDLGIHTGLFPIADVATDSQAFIYDRTIGQDAQGTSEFVETVVKALQEEQSGSTLKHFPGYGNNRDSHVEIVVDDRSLDELRANDFVPFIAGIKAGADSILVSHNIINSMDADAPASISPEVHRVLREELQFDGVVMTDDMDMAGLADFIPQEDAGLAALQAGNDLVMSSTYQVQIPAVIQAVQSGEYSEEQLDTSVRRVLEWKEKLGLIE